MSSSPASAPHLLSNSKQKRPTATATNDKAKDKNEDKDEDEDEDEGGYGATTRHKQTLMSKTSKNFRLRGSCFQQFDAV